MRSLSRPLYLVLSLIVLRPAYGGELAKGKVDIPPPCRELMVSALEGDAKKITQTLDKGANPNCRTESSRTTALMFVVTNGPLAAVEPLLSKGADVNAQDSAGSTALMFAAMLGHDDVVRALLKNGADAGIKNSTGQTALDLAKNSDDVSVKTRTGKDVPQLRRSGKVKVVEILSKQAPKSRHPGERRSSSDDWKDVLRKSQSSQPARPAVQQERR